MMQAAPAHTVRAGLVSAVVAALVVAPLFRQPPTDSFPLSTYPMFSDPIDALVDVGTVVGRAAGGERIVLSPTEIGGTDEVILAGATVDEAIRGGRVAVESLCASVADRIDPATTIAELEVVTERYDAIAYFAGDTQPIDVVVHARCTR